MFLKIKIRYAYLLCLLAVFGCKNDDAPDSDSSEIMSLVIGGISREAASGQTKATYWLGDQEIVIADNPRPSQIVDLLVDGDDVYAVGMERDLSFNFHAILWINGVRIQLTDQAIQSFASGITLKDGRWYVSGWDLALSDISTAKYWTSEGETVLGDGFQNTQAFGINVTDEEIKVVGTLVDPRLISNSTTAVQWQNGNLSILENGSTSVATPLSIERVGNDEYIYGSGFSTTLSKTISIVWKNGVIQELPVPENLGFVSPTGMSISDGDVYVSGFGQSDNTTFHTIYYKNGVLEEVEFKAQGYQSKDICLQSDLIC